MIKLRSTSASASSVDLLDPYRLDRVSELEGKAPDSSAAEQGLQWVAAIPLDTCITS